MDSEWRRSYESGPNAEEAKRQWTAHLTARGWANSGETQDDETYRQATFEHQGHKIEFKCSRMVEDKGWCTLTFIAKTS